MCSSGDQQRRCFLPMLPGATAPPPPKNAPPPPNAPTLAPDAPTPAPAPSSELPRSPATSMGVDEGDDTAAAAGTTSACPGGVPISTRLAWVGGVAEADAEVGKGAVLPGEAMALAAAAAPLKPASG